MANISFYWHPLFKYVMNVKTDYYILLKDELNDEKITYNEYEALMTDYDFKKWIEYLNNNANKNDIGYLKVFEPLLINQYGNLVLFKYRNYIDLSSMGYGESDFFSLYDGLYLECRSIVIDVKNDEIILASMSKFKNYGEDDGEWSQKNILNKIKEARKIEITNKMDGSYQQYRYTGYITKRFYGSGSQALNKEESWRLKRGYELLDDKDRKYKKMLECYPDYTFHFEFISPINPIVVKYTQDQEGLYLFNARNVYTGREMSLKQLEEIANEFNVPMVDWYKDETFEHLLEETGNYKSSEKEGWVIKIYGEHGENIRVKLKVDDYVLMHKALSNSISPNALIESIITDKVDDFISKVPIAYTGMVLGMKLNVETYLRLYQERIDYFYGLVLSTLKETGKDKNNKKDFMTLTDHIVPKAYNGYVKSIYLGRSYNLLTKGSSKSNTIGHISYNDILKFLEKEGYNYAV